MSCDRRFFQSRPVSSAQRENATLRCQPPLAVYFGAACMCLRIVIWMPAIRRRLLQFCDCCVACKKTKKQNGLERVENVRRDV